MKVYALHTLLPNTSFRPVLGYHSSLVTAKAQAKLQLEKSAEWEISLWEVEMFPTKDDFISMLNADTPSSIIRGKIPRDFIRYNEVIFQNAAMKRREKESKNEQKK